jgi:lipopolysaccharide biosynthesis protein
MPNRQARLIAFYLPQFHPIPENDQWWGPGFTEWINVARARPLFRGHDQPRIPGDLGFYDLRLPETREAQAALARQHGLEGFCYWHYWFNGRRLLEQPFAEVLESSQPDFPFCLAWANESWSRRWLGEEKQILIAQEYSADDDALHASWLLAAFADRRYLRVNGRPLFLVYRPRALSEPRRTADILRKVCLAAGLPEPYLVGIDAHCPGLDCRTLGFDATLQFEPQLGVLPNYLEDRPNLAKFQRNWALGIRSASLKVYDYAAARALMRSVRRDFPVIPSLFVGWDNTPRRGRNAIVIVNATPERVETGLAELISAVGDRPADERLVFVNAWNEWAEGNYLEPDLRNGHQRLDAIRRVLQPAAPLPLMETL